MLWTVIYTSLGVALACYAVIGFVPRHWILKNRTFVPAFLLPSGIGIPVIPGYRHLNKIGKAAYIALYLSVSVLIGTAIFGALAE